MSEIKVNKISPRAACGTVQLGDSGDTFTIPSGATINNQGTATNFGATGSASWTTTVKTTDFTAVTGEGYFVDTTSGEVDVTLPAGSAGDVVAVADYANTAETNNIILKQNGSDKIEGSTDDFIVNVEGAAVTIVFVDSTKGWIVTDTGNSTDASAEKYVTATGGTIQTCGNFKTHIFTGPGTFCVSCAGNASGSTTVDYFVVAGGGGSGRSGGGGGAGGFRVSNSVGGVPAPTMSPLANPTGLPVTASGFPITVGGAGAAGTCDSATQPAMTGSPSIFAGSSTITSAGGGGGANYSTPSGQLAGGSGGGAGPSPSAPISGAAGNTPPVSPPQGNPGGGNNNGTNADRAAGGGGGAGAAGTNGAHPSTTGCGGAGSFVANAFIGPTAPSFGEAGPVSSTRYFAGGGGGMFHTGGTTVNGGVGGGGDGGDNISPGPTYAGKTNTGSGGGGSNNNNGNTGGSGIVMIRYKFQ